MTKKYRRRMIVLGLVFLTVLPASFFLGRYSVSAGSLLRILSAPFHPAGLEGVTTEFSVIFRIRLPRVAAAALVGAALSTAGAAYQGMFRNPMVSPDILGASSGAGFGAALGIFLSFGYLGVTVSAFLFGLGAVLLAYSVSRFSRLEGTLSLVLAGVMISSLFTACTSFIKLIADAQDQLPAITYWLMGSLASAKLEDLPFVAAPVVIGLVPLFLLRWRVNVLTTEDDEAQSLGINTGRLRLTVIVCATMMTAASVAVSGMIAWVGLVIPHFCRLMFGFDYRRLIPASILMGAAFLVVVDNVARVAATSEIPLGILTSFIGAPVFVYLILTGGEARA
ncbi:MAG: iron ABC transporter permease [Peptococcaceae bacterium]|jgi:iron complex transport system permease protein|nr:iron ABC transporter permease [Peptococcaceae bacterium]